MVSKQIKIALLLYAITIYGCGYPSSTRVTTKTTTTQDGTSFLANVRSPKDHELFVKKDIEKLAKKVSQQIKEKRKNEQLKKERSTSISPLSITTYGVDCYGCGGEVDGRGTTSFGVQLDVQKGVRMPNGEWQRGIQYGSYYIIAADPSIPPCSILKISNHGLQGSGITPNEPYYAIVLDRGGAIYGAHIDLYIGSENSSAIVPVAQTIPTAEIIRMGGTNGAHSCAL